MNPPALLGQFVRDATTWHLNSNRSTDDEKGCSSRGLPNHCRNISLTSTIAKEMHQTLFILVLSYVHVSILTARAYHSFFFHPPGSTWYTEVFVLLRIFGRRSTFRLTHNYARPIPLSIVAAQHFIKHHIINPRNNASVLLKNNKPVSTTETKLSFYHKNSVKTSINHSKGLVASSQKSFARFFKQGKR